VLGVLNFAHGGFYMLGAYVTLAVVTNVVDNFWLAVVAGALAVGVVGAAIEFAAIRPLYDRVDADLDQLIVTFGFVLVIHEAVRFIWGSGSYSIDPPDVFNFSVALGGSTFSAYRLVVIGLAVAGVSASGCSSRGRTSARWCGAPPLTARWRRCSASTYPRACTPASFLGSVLAGLGGGAPRRYSRPARRSAIR